METKICKSCGKEKPKSEYYRNFGVCRECVLQHKEQERRAKGIAKRNFTKNKIKKEPRVLSENKRAVEIRCQNKINERNEKKYIEELKLQYEQYFEKAQKAKSPEDYKELIGEAYHLAYKIQAHEERLKGVKYKGINERYTNDNI